ncbi:MAG: zf-TFIIB domain-containing protein [Candidatus Cloacimonetes bacterium]|nr:zf-TFIIB domain-containing protein [Candidatus Cloacimonadota bacterium]
MQCPVCKTEMIVLELSGIEIDHCYFCKGIWLDSDELELLLDEATDKQELLSTFITNKRSKERKYNCPVCNKKMEKVLAGKTLQVHLDRCRAGHGLWFDKGELYQVIRMGGLDKENKIVLFLKDMFDNKELKEGK